MLTKPEIRQLGTKEMTDELQKSRRELLRNQFEIRTGSSKEVHLVKNLKRYIARLQTIAKEAGSTTTTATTSAAAPEVKASTKAKKSPAPKKSSQKKPEAKVKATKKPVTKKSPAKSTKK